MADTHDDTLQLDCLIIGAGPAGLTAATYLSRFHRRIVVLDGGSSRARWIPTSHNFPGYPFGVGGTELLCKLREQATGYGAPIEKACVARLTRDADGVFEATAEDGRRWRAPYVLLATGVVDRMPALTGLEDAIAAGAVRLCAVCDGYEASDVRIAVYAPVDEAVGHAVFLRTFSRRVSVLPLDDTPASDDSLRRAGDAGVPVLPVPTAMRYENGHTCVEFDDAPSQAFDTLYPVLGGDPQAGFAVELGAKCDDKGELLVDEHLQTAVDGLYAIGDVVSALNQISVATGHAAIAATAVHNRLPHNFREQRDLQPETAPELPEPEPGPPRAA